MVFHSIPLEDSGGQTDTALHKHSTMIGMIVYCIKEYSGTPL